MALTKAELVLIVSENCSFPRRESIGLVEQVFEIIKENLEKGKQVKISGFGNFVVRENESS